MRSLVGTLILAGFIAGDAAAADGFRVIVNAANPVRVLTREQLAAIFLKKAIRWGNGVPVTPVDQVDASAIRAAFSREILGKGVPEVASYWQRQILTGRELPPIHKPSDAAVVEFVKANPGGIGYVSADPDGTDVTDVVVVAVVAVVNVTK